jgi:hypothetical protein
VDDYIQSEGQSDSSLGSLRSVLFMRHRLQFAAFLKDNRMGVTPPVRQLTIQRKESNALSKLKTIN